ncbi:EthD family reductase [Aggregatilinea lenta]|uniref:EthD family reductase n=1 Tax=Aggregatilinea lenta TaxID=913108 RepID=UPI000E5B92C2|nr:EthD family reductase [Aggregatilinea lenta]
MVKLVLLFKPPANKNSFELRYSRNLSMLRKLPGVQGVQVGQVLGGPAGDAPYFRIVEIHFPDFDTLDAALVSPDGVAAGKDLMDYAGAVVELLFVEVPNVTSADPLTPDHVSAYIEEHKVLAEIVYPGVPTPTVTAAAQALNVEPEQIVKSVVFLVNKQPFLVYGCGTRRVDPAKLAARLQVNPDRVQLADADQVFEITGYNVGTVPPLALKTPMPAFMDPAVQANEIVYAGGGGIDALLKIASAELLRHSKAEVADLLEDEPAPQP